MKSSPSKWGAATDSSCSHTGMICASQLPAPPLTALHLVITTSFAHLCSVKWSAARAAGRLSPAPALLNLLNRESLKSCSLETFAWFTVCQVFVLSFSAHHSSLGMFSWFVNCWSLGISVPHGYLWFGFLHLSFHIYIYIYICIPVSIPLQLLKLTEFSASLRVLPAALGQNKPVSASLHSHTGTQPVIKPFQWPQKISTYGNYGTINLKLQAGTYKSPFQV